MNFDLGDSVVVFRRSSIFDNWEEKIQGYVVAVSENSVKIRVESKWLVFFSKFEDIWINCENNNYHRVEKIK